MTFPDPGVRVHRAAGPSDLTGPPEVRFVAPGSATAGRYGLAHAFRNDADADAPLIPSGHMAAPMRDKIAARCT